MAGRPGTLPWNMATFTGANPVTTLSDNFNFLNGQINDSGAGFTNFAIDTGTPNNLIVTLPSPPVAYEAGMMICVVPANTNTGTSTINVNSLGNQGLINPAGLSLTGGEIPKGFLTTMVFDGTNFRIITPCGGYFQFLLTTGNHTVSCAGYTSVSVLVSWNVNTSTGLTLNNVASGTPISICFVNGSGSANAYSINMTDPSGTAFIEVGNVTSTGSFVDLTTGATTAGAGLRVLYTGVSGVRRMEFK